MMKGRRILYLFIGICLSLAVYLFYVDKQRKESVTKYFPSPQVGDVYKIKRDEEDGKSWVHYLKITSISDDSIYFIPSKFMADASADYILNHYDQTSTIRYSLKDLREIKEGKWKNWQKDNASLIEIIRK